MTHQGFDSPFHFDMAITEPVFAMMQRGVKVDQRKKAAFRHDYTGKWKADQEKLNTVAADNLNVNSPKQVMEFLYDELGLPERRYRGRRTSKEEALRALLAICEEKMKTLKTDEAKYRWQRGYLAIMFILRIRGYRKALSSYINTDLDGDSRMRTMLSVGGSETGRFSSGKTMWDTGCNMQTIPRSLRSMFIPDDGMELAEFDLERGESWIYAHLSEDPVMMEIHQQGRDFHAETAVAISSAFSDKPWTLEDLLEKYHVGDDEAYMLRYLGKRVNHASAYQMGPQRGAEIVNKEADETGITITTRQFRFAQELWREKYVGIPKWWGEIERTVRKTRTMYTPYGRKRIFYGFMNNELFKEATAYVPQSTSVDYLNLGMLRVWEELDRKGALDILMQVHDSILIQYPEGDRDEIIPQVIELLESKVVVNGHEITIPVEAAYGPSWGTLTEWER